MGAVGVCQRYRSGQAPQPSEAELIGKEPSDPKNLADLGRCCGKSGLALLGVSPLLGQCQHHFSWTDARLEIVGDIGKSDSEQPADRAIGDGGRALKMLDHGPTKCWEELVIGQNHLCAL